ncbi:hypothetical protein [Streptomyces chartreusis]|uniref:hypothetical protein n=1 Tax=Streptomyces chartreusis TaxID=1969 RepID=UPI00365C157C
MNDYLADPPARRLRLAGGLKFCLEMLAHSSSARRRRVRDETLERHGVSVQMAD